MDVWTMVDEERIDFADLCDPLAPAQWDQVSLCSEDLNRLGVVAHRSPTAP